MSHKTIALNQLMSHSVTTLLVCQKSLQAKYVMQMQFPVSNCNYQKSSKILSGDTIQELYLWSKKGQWTINRKFKYELFIASSQAQPVRRINSLEPTRRRLLVRP